jgi:hypothetical protein
LSTSMELNDLKRMDCLEGLQSLKQCIKECKNQNHVHHFEVAASPRSIFEVHCII